MGETSSGAGEIPFLIGHRGACGHAPENTLPSIRRAADLGARWIEADVKLTGDGVPVLMHDQSLDRTTDGEGPIRDLTWKQVATLDAGGWFDPVFKGTRIARLDAAIQAMSELGLGVNLEIKPCPGREAETAEIVCRMVEAQWPASLAPPLLSSEAVESLTAVRDRLPACGRAVIADRVPEDWRERLESTASEALHIWHEAIAEDEVRSVMSAGYSVRAFTVNRRTRAVELANSGFAGIFSDFPDRMAGVEAASGGAP